MVIIEHNVLNYSLEIQIEASIFCGFIYFDIKVKAGKF